MDLIAYDFRKDIKQQVKEEIKSNLNKIRIDNNNLNDLVPNYCKNCGALNFSNGSRVMCPSCGKKM